MKKGVIVIHGLTGTPAVMAPVTEALSVAGFKVVTPLLPGHGTSKQDLSSVKWKDWAGKIVSTYNEFKKNLDEVFCVGLSLGSLLALHLAMTQSNSVKRVICIGLPLRLSPLLEKFLLPVSHIPPIRQIIRYSKKDWKESVYDEKGREMYKNSSYSEIPVRSVWELQKLQKTVIKRLPSLSVPALLMHSRNDKVAPPSNVDYFLRLAPRTKAEVVWFDNSGHVLTLDHEKKPLTEKIVSFLSKPLA